MRARNLHADVSRGERRRAAKHRLRRTQMRIHARVPRVPRFHRRRHDRLPEATRRPFPDAATHQSHNRAAVRGPDDGHAERTSAAGTYRNAALVDVYSARFSVTRSRTAPTSIAGLAHE